MEAYEGAIDDLSGRGLIDKDHVGIIGYSRTCYYVMYTLTHSKYHIAAAAIADGIDGGYLQYMAFSNTIPPMATEFEALNAGTPFGPGCSSWVKRSPSFLMDQIQTHLRIEENNP